jgi:hypothetical protein
MVGAHDKREGTEAVTGREVGGHCSASPGRRFEQDSDLSDSSGTQAYASRYAGIGEDKEGVGRDATV